MSSTVWQDKQKDNSDRCVCKPSIPANAQSKSEKIMDFAGSCLEQHKVKNRTLKDEGYCKPI